jgi:hypothetical protein
MEENEILSLRDITYNDTNRVKHVKNNWELLGRLKNDTINDINKLGYNTSKYKFYISVFGVLIPFNVDEYEFICDELSVVSMTMMELCIGSELIDMCMMVGWVDNEKYYKAVISKSRTHPIIGFSNPTTVFNYERCVGIHQLNAEVIKEETKRRLLNFLLQE